MMEGMVSSPSQSKVSTAESTARWFRVVSSLERDGDRRSSLFVRVYRAKVRPRWGMLNQNLGCHCKCLVARSSHWRPRALREDS